MRANAERRQFGRRNSCLNGWILPPGRPRLACHVRNISVTGALLELPPPDWLPFQFRLLIEATGEQYNCEIRHVMSHGVGVTFRYAEAKEKPEKPQIDVDDVSQWMGQSSSVLKPRAATLRLR